MSEDTITANATAATTKTTPEETMQIATPPTSEDNIIRDGEISKNPEEKLDPTTPQKPVEEVSPKSQGRPRRTPKRMSFTERAQKESEELVKTMGGSLELEGGRRTRSSARGTPTQVITPPPTKRARTSPASASKTTTPRARGRGRKLDTTTPPAVEETAKDSNKEEDNKEDEKEIPKADAAPTVDVETNGPKKEEEANEENVTAEPKPEVETKENECNADKAQPAKAEQKAESNDKSEKSKDVEKVAEDQLDAALFSKDTANTEVQKSVGNDLKSENAETNAAKKDVAEEPSKHSPMDVDESESTIVADEKDKPVEGSSLESSEARPTVLLEKVIEKETSSKEEGKPFEKQPTPEPMEVDSNSKSNDAVGHDIPDSSISPAKKETVEVETKSKPQQSVEENISSVVSQQSVPETVSAPLAAKTIPDVTPTKPETICNNVSNLINSESKHENNIEGTNNGALAKDIANKIGVVSTEVINQVHQPQTNELKSVGNNIKEDKSPLHLEGKSSQETCEPQIISPTQMTPVSTADGSSTVQ